MIILLCGCDKCGLNAHSVDPDSMHRFIVDRPLVVLTGVCFQHVLYTVTLENNSL